MSNLVFLNYTRANLYAARRVVKPATVREVNGRKISVDPIYAELKLLPGINKVPSELWGLFYNEEDPSKGFEAIHILVDSGAIKIEVSEKSKFAELTIGEARRMIRETFDPKVLNEWQASDKRSAVQRAIQEQINRIEAYTLKDGRETVG